MNGVGSPQVQSGVDQRLPNNGRGACRLIRGGGRVIAACLRPSSNSGSDKFRICTFSAPKPESIMALLLLLFFLGWGELTPHSGLEGKTP